MRPDVFGFHRIANGVGAFLGPLLAGLLADAASPLPFGTQAGLYGQQLANSLSPLGYLLGGLGGNLFGSFGKTAGAGLAGKIKF